MAMNNAEIKPEDIPGRIKKTNNAIYLSRIDTEIVA